MTTNNTQNKKSKRIFYFDALRALAILSVIVLHLATELLKISVGEYDLFSWNWIISNLLYNCSRFGVDIFLMLSGALSLGRVWDIKSFLSKRLPRITAPFLFWGFILSLVLVIFSTFLSSIHTIDPINIQNFLNYLLNSYLGENQGFGPYWFFWMIFGTYLIMPIFNKWLLNCDLKEVEYFLVLWIITCIFENTLMTSFPIKLSYFSGAIGMVILGYYLRHTKREIFNNKYAGLILTLLGLILTFTVTYLNSSPTELYKIDRMSIYLVIESAGIFLLFKNFNKFNIHIDFFENPKGIFKKSIFSIAKYSYGMYLNHRVITMILSNYLKPYHLQYKPYLLILFISTMILSWGIMAALNRIPYLNKIIGAK